MGRKTTDLDAYEVAEKARSKLVDAGLLNAGEGSMEVVKSALDMTTFIPVSGWCVIGIAGKKLLLDFCSTKSEADKKVMSFPEFYPGGHAEARHYSM